MSNNKLGKPKDTKPYYSTLKALFGELTKLLKKLHHQLARTSNEQEVSALLTEFLAIRDDEIKQEMRMNEMQGIQKAILDVANRFPLRYYNQIRDASAPIEDTAQLREFLRQLAYLTDKQDIPALVAQYFPVQ